MTDPDQIIALTLSEQERLDTQVQEISSGRLDADQLRDLHDEWVDTLGYDTLTQGLLYSIERLVQDLDDGEYDAVAYSELALQCDLSKAAWWYRFEQGGVDVSRGRA